MKDFYNLINECFYPSIFRNQEAETTLSYFQRIMMLRISAENELLELRRTSQKEDFTILYRRLQDAIAGANGWLVVFGSPEWKEVVKDREGAVQRVFTIITRQCQELQTFFEGHILPTQKPRANKENAPRNTPLGKALEEYGEFLSTAEVIDLFHLSTNNDNGRRTIFNWEKEGYLINVAPQSDETTSTGKRKRGGNKLYRKDSILKNTYLQEKFNATCNSLR